MKARHVPQATSLVITASASQRPGSVTLTTIVATCLMSLMTSAVSGTLCHYLIFNCSSTYKTCKILYRLIRSVQEGR